MPAKQKILIVDDDTNIAELISLYLIKECFDTQMVHDGEEALTAFKEFQPNLILLDLMLPGIDGYQVCREIRKTSNVPIIMLSAKGEIFDKVLGLELGADDYVIKPFDSKELVARVKAVLRRTVVQPAPTTPAAPQGDVVSFPDLVKETFRVSDITYTGLPAGMAAKILTKEVTVTLRGTKAQIEAITEEDLSISVDLSAAELGTDTYKALINTGKYGSVGAVGSYSVYVEVTESARAILEDK